MRSPLFTQASCKAAACLCSADRNSPCLSQSPFPWIEIPHTTNPSYMCKPWGELNGPSERLLSPVHRIRFRDLVEWTWLPDQHQHAQRAELVLILGRQEGGRTNLPEEFILEILQAS